MQKKKKIKVALIINEFFGADGTAFGGYGFLARKYIAKYIPDHDIEMDVLVDQTRYKFKKTQVDEVNLYRLPSRFGLARLWLWWKNYDVYLSVELVTDFFLRHEPRKNKKLVLWIQDPRPWSEWREINTVQKFPETCYYNQSLYDFAHDWYQQGRIKFVSQAHFLNEKAIDLYRLPNNVPIQYLPNPVDIDMSFDVSTYPKKNHVIFLGRIESVKRGWLFCEIAKALPEYEFYMLGQTFREAGENATIMAPYKQLPNLHFAGHVDGEIKEQFLKDAKVLVNTSIHEALPVSFLEALAYGTLLVSCRNPEYLTSRFGEFVGTILGDGYEQVPLFVNAVRKLMEDDSTRQRLATEAIDYVRTTHNVPRFIHDLRAILHETAQTK